MEIFTNNAYGTVKEEKEGYNLVGITASEYRYTPYVQVKKAIEEEGLYATVRL